MSKGIWKDGKYYMILNDYYNYFSPEDAYLAATGKDMYSLNDKDWIKINKLRVLSRSDFNNKFKINKKYQKEFSEKDKIKYYQSRINDNKLSKNKRIFAKRRLKELKNR